MPVIPVRSHHSKGGKKITSPPITRSWGRLLDRAEVNAIKPREGITRNCTPSRSPIQSLRGITAFLHYLLPKGLLKFKFRRLYGRLPVEPTGGRKKNSNPSRRTVPGFGITTRKYHHTTGRGFTGCY